MDDRVKQFEQLSAYLDGELTAEQALDLERALAKDAEMASELESLRKTRQFLRDLPAEPAPRDFAHKVMARSRLLHPVAQAGIGGAMRASRWISFAAAAVVLIAAGVGMYIVVNSAPTAGPQDRLAATPGPTETHAGDIAVADLPVERIFAADLLMARQDVADVLVRNGVTMIDHVETIRSRRALAVPVAGTTPRMSQTVQVAADTVEIEVLVEPAVAKQILTELTEVQDRQVAVATVAAGMYASPESPPEAESREPTPPAPPGAPVETVADALPEDGLTEDRMAAGEHVALESPPQPTEETDEDDWLTSLQTPPSPAEVAAVRGYETVAASPEGRIGAAEDKDDPYQDFAADHDASGRSAEEPVKVYARAGLETDAAALTEESEDYEDGEPAPSEEEYEAAGRRPGRPWFDEDDEAAAAPEPAEKHAEATVVADDEDTAEDLGARGGEQPTAEDLPFADGREGEGRDQAGKLLPRLPAEADSDGAGLATTGAKSDTVKEANKLAQADRPAPPQAVQLQRLVIILQQVPAEQLPTRANLRGEDVEIWRRASRTRGE